MSEKSAKRPGDPNPRGVAATLRSAGFCDYPSDKSMLSPPLGYWYFYAAFVSLLGLNSVTRKTGGKSS